MKTCCDCGLKKLAGSFNWNPKTRTRNAWCRVCGRLRKSKRLFSTPGTNASWCKPNLSMSILGK